MADIRSLLRRFLADEPYRRLPEDDLWAQFRDRQDEAAFRVFLGKCGDRIYHRCRGLLGDDAAAEDAFQETFLALIRHRSRLPTYRSAMAWLYETATNNARRILRTRQRSAKREWDHGANGSVLESASEAAELIHQEERSAVTAALIALPSRERRAIELVHLEGMTHAEAADALGWSRGAVGTYVGRGLNRLRGSLGARGLATLAASATVESALRAEIPGLSADRLDALAESLWRQVMVEPVGVGSGWLVGKPLWISMAGLFAGIAVVGGIMWGYLPAPPPPPPDPPPTHAVQPAPRPPAETLQARNLRITLDEIVPQLREILQKFYPPDNLVRLTGIRAFGSVVEFEFETEHPPPEKGLAARFRGWYCVFRRRLVVSSQPTGEDRWYQMDPARPFILRLPGLYGGEVVRGKEEFAEALKLFDRLPQDDRAEGELLRHLFGPPGDELLLPAHRSGVSGFDSGIILATDEGLFVRDKEGRWRYAGECPGWYPVVVGDRVYCTEHGMIRSRPLADPAAAWEVVCPEPQIKRGENAQQLFVAGRLLYQAVNPGVHCFRPLDYSGPTWDRISAPLWPNGLAVAGGRVFGNDLKWLLVRVAPADADPSHEWEPVAPWPTGCDTLVADGDQFLAFGGVGPIYARPVKAGSEVPWAKVGRVHDPFKQ